MKRSSVVSHNSGTFPSPRTLEHPDSVRELHRGCSSERVPLPANSSRRHISTSALMPLNSGRALPSKWEDAERWITSPVSCNGTGKASHVLPPRRPKSKSGPLGQLGTLAYSNYSPAMQVLECGVVKNFMAGSPFSTGVMFADGLSIGYSGGNGGQPHPLQSGQGILRSVSEPAWADTLSEASLPSSQEEKHDSTKDAEILVSPVVSRRDMATQMSPKDSRDSSPIGRSPLSPSASLLNPIFEPLNDNSTNLETRDVQVDKRVTMIRWSKKHGARTSKKGSSDSGQLTKNATDAQASSWDIAEAAKSEREEAKIDAWENLQKAKAEAAIQKLEMELEKKRSSSMDKILNKLRKAQIKAQELRSSLPETQSHSVPNISLKLVSLLKNVRKGSLSGCFTCQAL